MQPLTLSGHPLALLPCGAAFLPAEGLLLVADAHFGKAQSFRRLGVPVPEATTAHTLERLTSAVARTGARGIVFLGDFLHAARGRSAAVLEQLARWRDAQAHLSLTLVRGNHDDRAGDPPPALGISVVDEPLRVGPFALCHHPRPLPGAYVLAGHWHPCIRVGGRAFDRLRLPCFWFGDDSGESASQAVGVLPAFGSFTGMHPIQPRPRDRVFVTADEQVRELPLCG